MEKNEYQKPEVAVLDLEVENTILSASNPYPYLMDYEFADDSDVY